MDKFYKKYKGIHPGVILKRELNKRSIKERPFALSLNEHPQTLNAITNGKRGISVAFALKAERALEMEEGTLSVLQVFYEIYQIKEQEKYETQQIPNLKNIDSVLFWDTDIRKIDWKQQYRAVIQRVFERGDEKAKEEMIRFYGVERVKQVLRELEPKNSYRIYTTHHK